MKGRNGTNKKSDTRCRVSNVGFDSQRVSDFLFFSVASFLLDMMLIVFYSFFIDIMSRRKVQLKGRQFSEFKI